MIGGTEAHIINWIPPGIQQGHFQLMSSNSDYFAYASYLSVYVFDINNLKIKYIRSSTKVIVAAICLNQKINNLMVIGWINGVNEIIDLNKSETIFKFITKSSVLVFTWMCESNTLSFYISKTSSLYQINISEDSEQKEININNERLNYMQLCSDEIPKLICANRNGRIFQVNLQNSEMQFIDTNPTLTSICVDPSSRNNCVITWEDGTIGFYELSDRIIEINKAKHETRSFGASAWLKQPPGHFITGDSSSGILRIWNPASDTQIDSIDVYPLGFHTIICLTEDLLFCTFIDYFIGVYSLKKRRFLWKVNSGHSNTIFSVSFHPQLFTRLYTAGAEGQICIWDIDKLKQITAIKPSRALAVIVTMEIAPSTAKMAVGYKDGRVDIISLRTNMAIMTFDCGPERVSSLSFSSFDPDYLLIITESARCFLYDTEEGKMLKQIETSSKPMCAVWSPREKDVFAVCCYFGVINIFRKGPEPAIWKETGVGKFYEIKWSPFDPNVLLATNDQGELVAIDISTDQAQFSIIGIHVERARPCVFHPTIKILAATGGFDGFVQIYNLESHQMISRFKAHSSHIYSLAFSADNPFLLVTAGRDSTVRFWSIDRILMKEQISQILMNGRIIFRPLTGFEQITKLVNRLADEECRICYNQGDIVHLKDLPESNKKKILSYKCARVKTKAKLIETAKQAMIAGDITTYCELMFEVGEFNKAIAAAPMVSAQYWKELSVRRIEGGKTQREKAKLAMLAGNMDKATEHLAGIGDYKNALTASVVSEYSTKVSDIIPEKKSEIGIKTNLVEDFNDPNTYENYSIISRVASGHLRDGNVLLAAASYLSIGDIEKATSVLVTNGELLSAIAVQMKLGRSNMALLERLAKIAASCSLDLDLIFPMLDGPSQLRVAVSINHEDRYSLKKFLKDHSISTSAKEATNSKEAEEILEALLECNANEAAQMAVGKLIPLLSQKEWDFELISSIVIVIELIPLQKVSVELCDALMILAFTIHAFEAAWKGYNWAFERLKKGIALVSERTPFSWSNSLVGMVDVLSNFIGNKSVTISPAGINVPEPCFSEVESVNEFGHFVELGFKERVSYALVLQWISITTFSPLFDRRRYYM